MRKVFVATLAAVMFLPATALAHRNYKDPGTCALSVSNGDLIVTGSGWNASTEFQYELYSTPPSSPGALDSASVGGGQFFTDTGGNIDLLSNGVSNDLGPLSFYMNVYQGETTLTFDVYPVNNQTADLTAVLGSCSITP